MAGTKIWSDFRMQFVCPVQWFSKCGGRTGTAGGAWGISRKRTENIATAFKCVNGVWCSAFIKRHRTPIPIFLLQSIDILHRLNKHDKEVPHHHKLLLWVRCPLSCSGEKIYKKLSWWDGVKRVHSSHWLYIVHTKHQWNNYFFCLLKLKVMFWSIILSYCYIFQCFNGITKLNSCRFS